MVCLVCLICCSDYKTGYQEGVFSEDNLAGYWPSHGGTTQHTHGEETGGGGGYVWNGTASGKSCREAAK